MSNLERAPIGNSEQQESIKPFALYKELLDFGEETNLGYNSYDIYLGDYTRDRRAPVELPPQFEPIVQDYPGSYYVVANRDVDSFDYDDGRVKRIVTLSTVPVRTQTNEKIRKIDIAEVTPRVGDHVVVKVEESINNKSCYGREWEDYKPIEDPHGSLEYTYIITPDGKMSAISAEYHRFDEALFQFEQKKKRVRWNRSLRVEKENAHQKLTYNDLYTMDDGERRASITTSITGRISNPESTLIEIGVDPEKVSRVLYENAARNIKVVIYDQVRGRLKSDIDIVKQDPMYATLLGESVDEEEFFKLLEGRIKLLQAEWDKPETVYSPIGIEKK